MSMMSIFTMMMMMMSIITMMMMMSIITMMMMMMMIPNDRTPFIFLRKTHGCLFGAPQMNPLKL